MKHVPFFPNTADNLHCYQACLKMVLKYFLPQKDFSFDTLDELTGQKEGLWTWPIRGLISLINMGFDIRTIQDFDVQEFIIRGLEYISDKHGPLIAREQNIHGDVEQARRDFRENIHRISNTTKIPTFIDLRQLLNDGYLVICNVNAKAMQHEEGYEGHFVCVYNVDSSCIFLHDPGLPFHESVQLTFDEFERVWAYPDAQAKNIMAFKL